MTKKAKAPKKSKKADLNPHGFGAPGTKKPHGKPFSKSQLENALSNDEDEEGESKGCPRCKKHKPITEFGLRRMKNAKGEITIRRQSYCNTCRVNHKKKMKDLRAA